MNQLFRGYWMSGSSSARQQNGIFVQVLFLVEEQAATLQVADDVAIGLLDPAALVVGGLGGEGAVGGDGVDELRALAFHEAGLLGQQNVEVNLAEGRGLVDDAGARIDGDEVGRHDPPGNLLPAAGLELALDLAMLAGIVVERRRCTACPQGLCRGSVASTSNLSLVFAAICSTSADAIQK